MSRFYTDHHVDEMTEPVAQGLMFLSAGDGEGPLSSEEVAAVGSSPLLREWAKLQAASYGHYAFREMLEGRPVRSLVEWFGTMRPEIAAAACASAAPRS